MGATLLAAYNGRLNWKVLKEVTYAAYKTTAYIFAIFLGATCFALVLRELGGDELVERAITSLPFGPYGILIFILLIVFLLGFLLDWIEITLIILPLLSPIVAGLGFEIEGYGEVGEPALVWFVMLVAVTLQTSFLTPPVGFASFLSQGRGAAGYYLGAYLQGRRTLYHPADDRADCRNPVPETRDLVAGCSLLKRLGETNLKAGQRR